MSHLECITQHAEEIWKDVPGWEGYYVVSSWGRVKRVKVGRGKSPRFMTPCEDSRGYAHMSFSRDGKTKQTHVHRVVALAFFGPTNGRHVNHKNGDKMDNRVENLEYVTPAQNMWHAIRHGLRKSARYPDPFPRLSPKPSIGYEPRVTVIPGSTWRRVVGYEWLYEVSDMGQIRRLDTGRILTPSLSKGYASTSLSKNRKMTSVAIHRVVAQAFLGPSNGLVVNHVNNDRSDARLCNLEYVTQSQNMRHAFATASKKPGTTSLTPQRVREIDARVRLGHDPYEIAEDFRVQVDTVFRIEKRQSWGYLLPSLTPEQIQASAERRSVRRKRPGRDGQANPNFRFSDAIVLEIDKLIQGGVLGLDIAVVMGVKNHFVSAIKRRETRKYLFSDG